MNPRIKNVVPKKDYKLDLEFENGEIREFDITPYINKGIFKELRHREYFVRVKAYLGSIQWPNGQDFCPDTLYELSTSLSTTPIKFALSNGQTPSA